MKQTKAVVKKNIEKKSKATPAKFSTVAEYIAALPSDTKSRVIELRKIIKGLIPGAKEAISYNIPSVKLNETVIWYAGWKSHISLYPRTRVMEEAIPELVSYESAMCTIKIPLTQPLPKEMIQKVVKLRLKEIGANG